MLRSKLWLANAVMLSIASCVACLGLEVALRVYHGGVFDFSSQLPTASAPQAHFEARAVYDSVLGWVPSAGAHPDYPGESATDDHLRSNGTDDPPEGRRIVVVGDSFTYGDEVTDSATWPAQLGRVLPAHVMNAGVFGYGVDQAALRASRLLERHQPDWVGLAFIQHNILRSERSYHYAWKPYFLVDGDTLIARNRPVPREGPPEAPLAGLRKAFGRSYLAAALSRRLFPGWWHFQGNTSVHSDGPEVVAQLLVRLNEEVRSRGARLLVVGLATGRGFGGNQEMSPILSRLSSDGVSVLDLVSRTETKVEEEGTQWYMPWGHYSPSLNRWVAEQVADHISAYSADTTGRGAVP